MSNTYKPSCKLNHYHHYLATIYRFPVTFTVSSVHLVEGVPTIRHLVHSRHSRTLQNSYRFFKRRAPPIADWTCIFLQVDSHELAWMHWMSKINRLCIISVTSFLQKVLSDISAFVNRPVSKVIYYSLYCK